MTCVPPKQPRLQLYPQATTISAGKCCVAMLGDAKRAVPCQILKSITKNFAASRVTTQSKT